MSEPVAELAAELEGLSRSEIIALLAEANVRAGEAEQFLNYAPIEQVFLHRRRVAAAQYSQGPFQVRPAVPMPRVVNGRSVWNPPRDLLSFEQAMRLPIGAQVQWIGDRSEGGLRKCTAIGWRPLLSPSAYYWLLWAPSS